MFARQHQADALQRKRVDQRTSLVREHLQCFCKKHTSEAYARLPMEGSFAADLATTLYRVITGGHFELPLPIKVQKVGFQNQAGETLLEKDGSASVHDYVHANRTFQVRFRCDVEYTSVA